MTALSSFAPPIPGSAPGIIFIDINLPCADGFDLLETICGEPCLAESVKVILSGGGNKEDTARRITLGAVFYLIKPFHFQHMQHIAAESSKVMMRRIGLAICQKVIERHGSDISVASTPGEGSTLTAKIAKNILENDNHNVVNATTDVAA